MTALVAPAGAVPALQVVVVQAAGALARALGQLVGASSAVREAGFGTDPTAAAQAAQAVRTVEEALSAALRELLTLGRLLGAAQASLDAVEAELVRALLRPGHDLGLGRVARGLLTAADAVVTLGAQAAVASAPACTHVLVDGAAALVPEGPGDATPLPDQLPGGDRGQPDVAGWLRQVDALGATPGRIAVTDTGDGAWVVQLPGIHSLLPAADPQDLPGALAGLGTGDSAYAGAVVVALTKAGVPPGARVLLVGHSQGGLVATGLSADPAVAARWRITHVVTAGSPVSRSAIGRGTQLLDVVNRRDLVTALDSVPSADAPGRTSLVFSREHLDIGRNHGLRTTYLPFLAGPAAADPRAQAFSRSAAAFLRGGPARTQVFAVHDRPPSPPRAPGPPLPQARASEPAAAAARARG